MRLAIFSDIHGNIVGLDACLKDLEEQGGADLIVGAGDYCMDGPRPKKVIERLSELGAACVRGNTDRAIVCRDLSEFADDERLAIGWQRLTVGEKGLRWLLELPFSRRFGSSDNELLVVHANPKDDEEHIWPDAADDQLERLLGAERAGTIAFGHLHLPYVRMWRGKMLVNVASAGLPKDGDARAGYAILTERSGGWQVKHRRVVFDVERVATQLKKSGIPDMKKRLDVLRRHRYKELKSSVP